MSSAPADLLPRARIRLAALELFGAQGFDKTTIRQIATRAGVSPGLVIHHFGSKTQLRQAVDEWVSERVLDDKKVMMAGAFMPRMIDYLAQHPELAPMLTYLVTALREDGPIAQRMFDRICELTEEILHDGIRQGAIRRLGDPEAVAVLLTAFSVGLLMFDRRVATKLGGQSLLDLVPLRRYATISMDLFTNGLFTDETYLRMTEAAFVQSEKDDDRQRNPNR